jgi:hypothetical protein
VSSWRWLTGHEKWSHLTSTFPSKFLVGFVEALLETFTRGVAVLDFFVVQIATTIAVVSHPPSLRGRKYKMCGG